MGGGSTKPSGLQALPHPPKPIRAASSRAILRDGIDFWGVNCLIGNRVSLHVGVMVLSHAMLFGNEMEQ